jgi:SAM-dependent methyltransferase
MNFRRLLASWIEEPHRSNNPSLDAEIERLTTENAALRAQLAGVGKERDDLRELGHKAGLIEVQKRAFEYIATRCQWQYKALAVELFGGPQPQAAPPREIPADLLDLFTLGGKVPVESVYMDETYPANWPLVYRDEEIDAYISDIRAGKNFIYGTLDDWVQEIFSRHPIAGLDVVTIGSRTPWYEAMILAHGGKPWALDYNRILCRTDRIKTMTTAEWEKDRPRFDYALSISSFEHDGLGAYGDPLDPEGDLKAMRKMKEILKPGGLLLLALPTGQDKILFNQARIYGRLRYPLLTEGWERVDSAGWYDGIFDANGDRQPVVVFRNG